MREVGNAESGHLAFQSAEERHYKYKFFKYYIIKNILLLSLNIFMSTYLLSYLSTFSSENIWLRHFIRIGYYKC